MLHITWHSNKRSSASQEIPRILCNAKVHYSIHKRPPPSLSEATSIQFMFPHPNSWRFILILSSHPRLRLPTKIVYTPLLFPHTCHTPGPSHSSWFDHPNNIWRGVRANYLQLTLLCVCVCVCVCVRAWERERDREREREYYSDHVLHRKTPGQWNL